MLKELSGLALTCSWGFMVVAVSGLRLGVKTALAVIFFWGCAPAPKIIELQKAEAESNSSVTPSSKWATDLSVSVAKGGTEANSIRTARVPVRKNSSDLDVQSKLKESYSRDSYRRAMAPGTAPSLDPNLAPKLSQLQGLSSLQTYGDTDPVETKTPGESKIIVKQQSAPQPTGLQNPLGHPPAKINLPEDARYVAGNAEIHKEQKSKYQKGTAVVPSRKGSPLKDVPRGPLDRKLDKAKERAFYVEVLFIALVILALSAAAWYRLNNQKSGGRWKRFQKD